MRSIRVHLPDGTTHVGSVVDLRDADCDIDADDLSRSVRFGLPVERGYPRVISPPPSPVSPFVAHLAREISFDRRGALATLARSRGHVVPEERTLERVESELADVTPPEPADLADARRRAAAAGAETERLQERAAMIRGRVEAVREAGGDIDAAEAELAETMTRLSEVATERVAARQRLEMLEARARAARDGREERMRLEDRAANLERAIRRSLAAAVYDDFADAVAALPDSFDADAGDAPGEYEGPPLAAALAVTRVAPLCAPVVADADVLDPFCGLRSFVRYLDAPVVLC
ncbi:hypothetical protein GL213_00380 [Halogeometricum borinquense]|uniref:Uncharacterized protein n=1 Tax=Halogeometricum borinquense TaxID=60847 RepID=A0A6C0UCP9_9EURY|nr:hypothetical protein [Halogeometricum borinquense]QIB72910.1 hypothetical protein G3I44_00575 [Halogeometricum borinquense]QIQ75132.1 hypothetical protein GL213_00380 [Halogeometricum borinquense]